MWCILGSTCYVNLHDPPTIWFRDMDWPMSIFIPIQGLMQPSIRLSVCMPVRVVTRLSQERHKQFGSNLARRCTGSKVQFGLHLRQIGN